MKKYFLLPFVSLVILFIASACQMDETNYLTAKFKVWGNCEMCKDRIEESVNNEGGIKSAVWDVKSKIMEVKYDSSVVKVTAIHEKIAAVGHDTERVTGEAEAYNSLHSCCKYQRKK